MTKKEVEKTNHVNHLSERLAALQALRETQRDMDLAQRKAIGKREADELNKIGLERHMMQKNNQILMKQ